MRSRETNKHKIKWEESRTNQLGEKSFHTCPVTTEWINNLRKCSRRLFTSIVCACMHNFVDDCCISYLLPDCLFLQWHYNPATIEIWKARSHLFLHVGGNAHTASPAQTHSWWAELNVMSVTLKTALKHVLQPLVKQVSQGKQVRPCVFAQLTK